MKLKISIKFKFLIGLVSLQLFLSAAIILPLYHFSYDHFYQSFVQNNLSLANTLSFSVDGDTHSKWVTNNSLRDPEYISFQNLIRNISKKNSNIVYAYSLNYDEGKNVFYYAVNVNNSSSDNKLIGQEYKGSEEEINYAKSVILNKGYYIHRALDKQSGINYLFSRTVILDSKGNGIGLLLIAFSEKDLFDFTLKLQRVIFISFIFSFIATVLFSLFLNRQITRPILILNEATKEIAKGNYNFPIKINSKDEFKELSISLGDMTSQISSSTNQLHAQAENLAKVNEAYSRFVPNEFLKLLEKYSILDVKLGDHIQKEMTILFSDIRQFTEMSEKMSPQENFNFLNSYLKVIGPIIRKHNGFIDKYIGDAIMALFAGSPDDALSAAIEIQEELRLFNFERAQNGKDPVKIGIGIHTGNLILGTIGEKERMEGTVIADAVNLASRIESLTKEYFTSILISEFSVRKMKDQKKFLLREIDYVVVKGKTNVVTVLECYNIDPKAKADKKQESTPYLFAGLFNFQSGNYEEAMQNFIIVQDMSSDDPIPVLHIKKCQDILANFASNPFNSELNPEDFKIMIIDDNEAILKLVEKILSKNKFQTMLCETGKEAVRKVENFKADLYLVNLQLSDINGIELIKKVIALQASKENKSPIFILMTGIESEESLLQANELGIRDIIRKPIDFKELMNVIRKRLQERKIESI